jgi:hypothetical protein
MPQRVTFGLSKKAFVAPISTLASGAAFVPPVATSMEAALGEAPPRATVVAPRPLAATAAPRLQGVDLRLDCFDLSEPRRVSQEARNAKPLDECFTMGNAFWSSLDDDSNHLDAEFREFLKQVFNPELSDRRSEGDLFTAPDASFATVMRLRSLLKEEDKVRQRRKEHFFSTAFKMSNPGHLFPASWAPSVEIAHDALADSRQETLRSRPEYIGEASGLLQEVLGNSTPVFDRITEEGLRFIIYKIGSLEVRTTQDSSGQETIGAVFSVDGTQTRFAQSSVVEEQDKVVKAAEYVERASYEVRSYVVFETEKGRRIVSECLPDGTVVWQTDAINLDDRNSLAKVIRSVDINVPITVGDIVAHQAACKGTEAISASARKRYAKRMYNVAAMQS